MIERLKCPVRKFLRTFIRIFECLKFLNFFFENYKKFNLTRETAQRMEVFEFSRFDLSIVFYSELAREGQETDKSLSYREVQEAECSSFRKSTVIIK